MFAAMPNEYGDYNAPVATKEMIEYLVGKGADPAIKDCTGLTAIDYLRQNIDPEWKDGFGYPARWSEEDVALFKELILFLEDRIDAKDVEKIDDE